MKKKKNSHKKLAVPYIGKDNPNKRSEFQNSDINIGFTCLMYFYQGITYKEFVEIVMLF